MDPREGQMGIIERVMDRCRPLDGSPAERMLPRRNDFIKTRMVFDPTWLPSTGLPTAGSILSDPTRVLEDGTFFIVHPNEPNILAAAVLRSKGIMAYPARCYEGEGFANMLALTDFAGAPLTTLRMLRVHPDIDYIDIMTDTAMVGVQHAIRAVILSNAFSVELVQHAVRGTKFQTHDIGFRLTEIADELFQYCMNWLEPGEEKSMMLTLALDTFRGYVTQAEAWKGVRAVLGVLPTFRKEEDAFLASRGRVEMAPELPVNKEHRGLLLDMDERVLDVYPVFKGQIAAAWTKAIVRASSALEVVQHMLKERLEKAQEGFEGKSKA